MSNHWIHDKRKRFREYEAYTSEVELRLKEALEELQRIADGVVFSDSPASWNAFDRLKSRASRYLLKESLRSKRVKPILYF